MRMVDPSESDSRRFFSKIQGTSHQVVIFGAGVAGEALFHVCRGFDIEAACFCDNNTNKTGKLLCQAYRHTHERHFFRCPFSANATMLGAVLYNPENFVQIVNPLNQEEDVNVLKSEISKFLSRQKPLESCDYCEGRPYGAPEIEPAVQAHCSLGYQTFFPAGRK